MALLEIEFERHCNPVDTIEQIAALNDWVFERTGDDEITISIGGTWSEYHISFSWIEDFEALHLACAFDLKVPEPRTTEVIRLLASVNEQLWIGHFDLWTQERLVMYRQSLLLAGGVEATNQQIDTMFSNAVEVCERYYQAFQFVIWAGKSSSEALDTALFETVGEA